MKMFCVLNLYFFSHDHSYTVITCFMTIFTSNNLLTVIRFQLFLSYTDNLYIILSLFSFATCQTFLTYLMLKSVVFKHLYTFK